MARVALVLPGGLVLAGLLSCRAGPEPPPLVRLLPALGSVVHLTLANVTRPATLMHPGERRMCAIPASPGGRVRLWVGLPKPRGRGGFLRIRIDAGDQVVAERRVAAARLSEWQELSGPVSAQARELAISVELETGGGKPFSGATENMEIAVGSPRLVRAMKRAPRVVVWISQDTVRADRVGAYGYGRPTTPVLDRFANDAILFENAMATASWTLPSLASQVTSLLPHEHGAIERRFARRREAGPTVFEVLARNGFAVLGATGNLFFSAPYELADGFDVLLVHHVARADTLRYRLQERLDEWDGGDLALFIHFMDPHLPYTPPAPYDTRFAPETILPAGASALERRLQEWSAAYDGEIAWTDAQIGKLLEVLERRRLLDHALIIYTADHGDEFLDHGRFDHGHTLYEELVHVPLVMRVPGRRPQRIGVPVSMLDVAPTLLASLGLEVPASFRGESLLPLAEGGVRRERRLYAETQATKPHHYPHYAVREGPLKCIVRFGGNGDTELVGRELFDLQHDPREKSSLDAAGHPLEGEARAYAAAARAARSRRDAVIDADVEQQLEALGYIK